MKDSLRPFFLLLLGLFVFAAANAQQMPTVSLQKRIGVKVESTDTDYPALDNAFENLKNSAPRTTLSISDATRFTLEKSCPALLGWRFYSAIVSRTDDANGVSRLLPFERIFAIRGKQCIVMSPSGDHSDFGNFLKNAGFIVNNMATAQEVWEIFCDLFKIIPNEGTSRKISDSEYWVGIREFKRVSGESDSGQPLYQKQITYLDISVNENGEIKDVAFVSKTAD